MRKQASQMVWIFLQQDRCWLLDFLLFFERLIWMSLLVSRGSSVLWDAKTQSWQMLSNLSFWRRNRSVHNEPWLHYNDHVTEPVEMFIKINSPHWKRKKNMPNRCNSGSWKIHAGSIGDSYLGKVFFSEFVCVNVIQATIKLQMTAINFVTSPIILFYLCTMCVFGLLII